MLELSWLLPHAILFQEMSARKKREKKGYEEIKRGKFPEPRKKRKSKTRGKMDKCPTVELGVQDTHLRGKKENIEHLILLK